MQSVVSLCTGIACLKKVTNQDCKIYNLLGFDWFLPITFESDSFWSYEMSSKFGLIYKIFLIGFLLSAVVIGHAKPSIDSKDNSNVKDNDKNGKLF